jgi:hypothetical protein
MTAGIVWIIEAWSVTTCCSAALTISDQPVVNGNAKAEKIVILASNTFHR